MTDLLTATKTAKDGNKGVENVFKSIALQGLKTMFKNMSLRLKIFIFLLLFFLVYGFIDFMILFINLIKTIF